jgi:hypothetical protein
MQATTFENRATSLLIRTKAFAEPLSFVPAKDVTARRRVRRAVAHGASSLGVTKRR